VDKLEISGYVVPGDGENAPGAICERLVRTCKEFEHLKDGEPRILILFRTMPKIKGGRTVLGECCMPSVQGSLRSLFEWLMIERFGFYPDFLILLDTEFWEASDDRTREALMFHELMHADQKRDQYGAPMFGKESGLPLWCVRPHDLEEFDAVVRRYGAWSPDIGRFVMAVNGLSHSE
jgi:hypothetical protein